MEDKVERYVELDESAVRPPRYGVPAPAGAEAFTTKAASRPFASSRGGSRGPASTEVDSKSSFLIVAVAENRAREIGNDLAGLTEVEVKLLGYDCDSLNRDLCDRLNVAL
uniref:Uncharacterized protein n=1 Tax=Hyaloperonospora arabidopsidis (strain Emoy2) TaxID=559515 RepID=M4B950_HYAAE